jgi:hypothetical protein
MPRPGRHVPPDAGPGELDQAPLSRSPNTQRSFLDLLNVPKYRPTIQRSGLLSWRHVAHLLRQLPQVVIK